MTEPEESTLPEALAELRQVGFQWGEEAHGVDFELYEQFEAPEITAWWFRLWTGNEQVDGSEFRFFGTTGAGDYAGFWLIRPNKPITDQPIVYLGSEGECGVIARDLDDLLWLFANGSGPHEAFTDPQASTQPNKTFESIAKHHAPERETTAKITAAAQAEFPNFPDLIEEMCR